MRGKTFRNRGFAANKNETQMRIPVERKGCPCQHDGQAFIAAHCVYGQERRIRHPAALPQNPDSP
jgi:hypothetical protein